MRGVGGVGDGFTTPPPQVNNMYECPVCGATSNRKNRPFETPEAVIGHINAKSDAMHVGEEGDDYRGGISESDAESVEGSQDNPDREAADSDPLQDHESDADETFNNEMDIGETLDIATEEAHEDGYTEGVNEGYEAGLQDGYSEAADESVTEMACPDCGSPLVYGLEGEQFHTEDGKQVPLEATDGYCTACELVVEKDGNKVYGASTSGGASGGWGGVLLGGFVAAVAFGLVAAGVIDEDTADEWGRGGGGDGVEIV
jgi:predicted RNA-binding Zn-ribbon protein involved in translation (DUF1610 family)